MTEATTRTHSLRHATRTRVSMRRDRSNAFGWLLASPYVIGLTLFSILPLAYAVYESLQPSTSLSGGNAFVAAFTDFRLIPALVNVGTYMVIYLPIMVVGTVVLALLVDVQQRRFGVFIRLVYVLPGVITGSASVLLWYLMLEPKTSPFGPVLNLIGFHSNSDVFIGRNLPVLFALMAFATGFGQWVVVLHGSLQSISGDVLEAAKIDGANDLQTALQIKVPLIAKYIGYMLVLSFAGALQIFAEPLILDTIANVGGATWSINQLGLYFAFNNGDFASAAALSLVLLVACLIVAVLTIRKGGLFNTEVTE